ncbi:hypothetical protein ACHAWF_003552 [Thalassiosira exigua]
MPRAVPSGLRLPIALLPLLLSPSTPGAAALALPAPPRGAVRRARELPGVLRVRGGAKVGAAPSASALSAGAEDGSGEGEPPRQKVAEDAVRSIRRCCRMAIFSVLADVVATAADDDLRSKLLGPGSSPTWVNYADAFDSLSLLAFAAGLWRIAHLYGKRLDGRRGVTKRADLLDLFRTMTWIWGVVAANLAIAATSAAAALPSHAAGRWRIPSPRRMAPIVAGLLGLGGAAAHLRCEGIASREVRAYYEERGSESPGAAAGTEAVAWELVGSLPAAGFRAYRNQALCGVAFGAFALLALARWIVSFDGGVVGHLFGAGGFLTPFGITALLFALNHAVLRAAIAAIVRDSTTTGVDDVDRRIYQELFQAQSGFYNEVAEMLKGAAILQLLPHVAAPIIPHIIAVLKKWKHIPLISKVVEKLS